MYGQNYIAENKMISAMLSASPMPHLNKIVGVGRFWGFTGALLGVKMAPKIAKNLIVRPSLTDFKTEIFKILSILF